MIVQFVYAFLATYGFGIIFNVRRQILTYGAVGGGLAWLVYYCLKTADFSTGISFLFSTIILTIYSEAVSRLLKIVVTSILIPGLIPLVPGSGIYNTMLAIIKKNPTDAFYKCLDTLTATGAITLGIIIVSSIVKIIKDLKKR